MQVVRPRGSYEGLTAALERGAEHENMLHVLFSPAAVATG